jgi:hypothetical protein
MAGDHTKRDGTATNSLTSNVRLSLVDAGLAAAKAEEAIEKVQREVRGIPEEHSHTRYIFIQQYSYQLAQKRLGLWATTRKLDNLSFRFQTLFITLMLGGGGGIFDEVEIKMRTIPEELSHIKQIYLQAVCDKQARDHLGPGAHPESVRNYSLFLQSVYLALGTGIITSLFVNELPALWDAGVRAATDLLKPKHGKGDINHDHHSGGSRHSATGYAHKPSAGDPRSDGLGEKSKPHSSRGVHHKGPRHHSRPDAQPQPPGSHHCDLPPIENGGLHSTVADAKASAMSEEFFHHAARHTTAAVGQHTAKKVVHHVASNHAEGIASYILTGAWHILKMAAGAVTSD